jgi:hypothetical protein
MRFNQDQFLFYPIVQNKKALVDKKYNNKLHIKLDYTSFDVKKHTTFYLNTGSFAWIIFAF